MIDKEQLVNNGLALTEAHLRLSQWDTKEDAARAMQVMVELAIASVAENMDMPRAITMVVNSLTKVATARGDKLHIDVLGMQEGGPCSERKH